ncbi:MAG: 5'-methylthioadenosine/S-adenosylhomocysteine nucleosidase [Clostridia bacterium]|nr:5'-methylthioadenosine/S-adenosylhomocysteine nucleosidase [Clostridia bacterium]
MKVAIIGAMDKEIERYLELYNPELVDEQRKIYKANSVIIAGSGIGKVNSAMMTQHLIDKYNVDIIISSGCAGSLNHDLKALDVIIPPYVTYHDFLPERVMRYSVPDDGNIRVDDQLTKLFKYEIEKMDNVNYVETPICSGDCYVTDDVTAKAIVERTGATVVDMESASIAHVARKNNVPFITIRTISDFADGNDDLEKQAADISSEIIYKCIEKMLANS